MAFRGIHLATILQAAHEILVHGLSLKIIILKLQPHLQGENELTLDQVIACCLNGTKRLAAPMRTYCQFESKYEDSHSRK